MARAAGGRAGAARRSRARWCALGDPDVLDDCGDVLRRDGVCEQRGRGRRDDGRWDEPGEVFGACAGAALYRRVGGARRGRLRRALLHLPRGRRPRPAAAARAAGAARTSRARSRGMRAAARRTSCDAGRRLDRAQHAAARRKRFPARWLPFVAYRQLVVAGPRGAQRAAGRAPARAARAGLRLLPARLRERQRVAHEAACAIEVAVAAAAVARPARRRSPAVGLLMRRAAAGWGRRRLRAVRLSRCSGEVEPHDEGLMLAWAGRIADGQWPYRDFWCNYAPGQPLLLAGLVKLFGPSLLSWRIAAAGDRRGRSRCSPTCWCARHASEGWALLGWLAAARRDGVPDRARAQRDGAGARARASPLAPRQRASARGRWRGWRASSGPRSASRARPARCSSRTRGCARRGRPRSSWLPCRSVPFLIARGGDMLRPDGRLRRRAAPAAPAVPVRAARRLRPEQAARVLDAADPRARLRRRGSRCGRRALGARRRWRSSGSATCSRAPTSSTSCRCRSRWRSCSRARRPRAPARARIVLGVLLALIAVHGVERQIGRIVHQPALAAVPGRRRRRRAHRGRPTRARCARSCRTSARASPPGGPVFVANPRFDLVHAGDPLLYVILDRPNPTRYDVMQPGVVTTAKVQREMVRDLAGTNLVVVWHDPRATLREDNGAGRSSGVAHPRRLPAHAVPPRRALRRLRGQDPSLMQPLRFVRAERGVQRVRLFGALRVGCCQPRSNAVLSGDSRPRWTLLHPAQRRRPLEAIEAAGGLDRTRAASRLWSRRLPARRGTVAWDSRQVWNSSRSALGRASAGAHARLADQTTLRATADARAHARNSPWFRGPPRGLGPLALA